VELEMEMLRSAALVNLVAVVLAALPAAVLMGSASSALAGERIVEIWNPPEARAMAPHAAVKRVRPNRNKVSIARRAPAQAHRLHANAAPGSSGSPALAASRARGNGNGNGYPAPPPRDTARFDDIPRIVTPEGNILRVGGGHAQPTVAH
jgi:hypothetical protein